MPKKRSSQPTIKDVARLARVSPATVSGVLRGTHKVSDISRDRVEQAIAALGYRPNAVAQALRTQHSQTLGLIIPDITNPFYADIARGVTEKARDLEYDVFLVTAGETFEELVHAAQQMASRHVEGLIVTSVGTNYPMTARDFQDVPYVLVNRQSSLVNVDYVGIDNRAGTQEVVNYLISMGHTRLAFLAGQENSSASRERLLGFLEATRQQGIAVPNEYIRYAHLNYQEAVAETQALMAMERRPTAIVAADDMMALGALQGLDAVGVAVPDEVSVVGFDGVWATALPGIELSTVIQPRYELGTAAVSLLAERIRGFDGAPRTVLLDYRLAMRRTTGLAPSSDGPCWDHGSNFAAIDHREG